MNEIIKQLEAKKINDICGLRSCAIDEGINIAIEILQSQTVIEAKALRKRGTDLFYYFDNENWMVNKYPETMAPDTTMEVFFSEDDLPSDAILVDIEIHIPKI